MTISDFESGRYWMRYSVKIATTDRFKFWSPPSIVRHKFERCYTISGAVQKERAWELREGESLNWGEFTRTLEMRELAVECADDLDVVLCSRYAMDEVIYGECFMFSDDITERQEPDIQEQLASALSQRGYMVL